jgi:nanoRNase/pAp phosphatase (c-di-AMP/oligoRNAs hydrolase)
MADPFEALPDRLDSRRPVWVQAHDFPDIDAVASAWGLASLLRAKGYEARCCYGGELRSRSLRSLVSELGIGLERAGAGSPEEQILVVDGSPANGNITLGRGELVGIIDHHRETAKADAPFLDLRPEMSACSTIIFGYWSASGVPLPRGVATALLAGIQSDTDFLSRRCSDLDFAAYAELYRAGDWELASRIVRKVLDLRELDLIAAAIGTASVRNGLLYALLRGSCEQEALVMLAEFALRAEELSAAVAAFADEGGVHFSIRTKSSRISSFDLVNAALAGIGRGGGHAHSAGGFVPKASNPGEAELRERFFKAAAEAAVKH